MFEVDVKVNAKTIDDAWESWYEIITKDAGSAESRDGAVVGEIINKALFANFP